MLQNGRYALVCGSKLKHLRLERRSKERKKKALSQEELAKAADTSFRVIQNIELLQTVQVEPGTLENLAKGLSSFGKSVDAAALQPGFSTCKDGNTDACRSCPHHLCWQVGRQSTPASEESRRNDKANLTAATSGGEGQERKQQKVGDTGVAVSGSVPAHATSSWKIRCLFPLQPAPHFAGRERILVELSQWGASSDTKERVIAIVAAGGTGKTAIAERIVQSLPEESPFGVFVWSFDENPHTDHFMREAFEYVTGTRSHEAESPLEGLQKALSANVPHLFILDGLEAIQADGTTEIPRGDLEDPLLRRFLRWLAVGKGTSAKALVTSRFPLRDLSDWRTSGFREIALDDLELAAARTVLARWNIKGDPEALDGLCEEVGCHALTLDVLGSYLATFHGGVARKAPTFDSTHLEGQDPKTAKLYQVLRFYSERLSAKERGLLARLSVFPHGIGVDTVMTLIAAGEIVAGPLHSCHELKVISLLERIRVLGLIYQYTLGGRNRFAAHPFLRQFFGKFIEDPRELHGAVRAEMSASLEDKPKRYVSGDLLKKYEEYIEVTMLAGLEVKALELFIEALGGYQHLSESLGENGRGLRLIRLLAGSRSPRSISAKLENADRVMIADTWGMFARNLGDLQIAREGFIEAIRMRKCGFDSSKFRWQPRSLSEIQFSLVEVELSACNWKNAKIVADEALKTLDRGQNVAEIRLFNICLGVTAMGQGKISQGFKHFAWSSNLVEEESDMALSARLWEAEWKFMLGDQDGAQREAEMWLRMVSKKSVSLKRMFIIFLCRCGMPKRVQEARGQLGRVRDSAVLMGNIELVLRFHQLAALVAKYEGKLEQAGSELEAGIELADSCGFMRWAIDLRVDLAEVRLLERRPDECLAAADEAIKRSDDCGYIWGISNGRHTGGLAFEFRGDKEKARDYLEEALQKRRGLRHPGVIETEEAIERLNA